MIFLKEAEAGLRAFLLQHIDLTSPRGLIECDSHSFRGEIKAGRIRKTSYDLSELLRTRGDSTDEFFDHLRRLWEESEHHELGPFYRLDVEIEGKKIDFEYSWENAPFESLGELKPPLSGKTPDFLFKQRFDEELIAFVEDHELDTAVSEFVAYRRNNGQSVPEPLLDMYALVSWHWTIVSEGFMQHFADLERVRQPLPVVEWYERAARVLSKLDQADAQNVMKLSLGLYSSLYKAVEPIRIALGVNKVTEIDENDLYDKFGAVESQLQKAWRSEIRSNPSHYAVPR